MTYASETSISPERTKAEIEQLLTRYGATKFFSGWDADRAMIGFSMADRFVQFILPIPELSEFTRTRAGHIRNAAARRSAHEQAQRSAWRALLLCIKAKLESVESGIESFEEAFLSHILVEDGHGGSTTVGSVMIPKVAESYEGRRPQLALPSGYVRPVA